MKSTLLVLLASISIAFVLTNVAQAQQGSVTNAGVAEGLASSPVLSWGGQAESLPPSVAANAPDATFSYFDLNAPVHDWVVPSQWGTSLILYAAAELITLNGDAGFLDSVQIGFDAISGDNITVKVDPDTIYQLASGPFHLVNIFDANAQPISSATVAAPPVQQPVLLTLRYAHIPVPKYFHIVVFPNLVGTNFQSAFLLKGDSEEIRAKTIDNCHSSFIGINTSNSGKVAGLVDSFFVPPGDIRPLYSNFYITAYASSSSSGVATALATRGLEVFPNPASERLELRIPSGTEVREAELFDALGRSVLHSTGSQTLDVSGLAPGRYQAVLHTASGLKSAPVVIAR